MSRKLPVYILVDTSGSMLGEPIQAVNNGVKLLIRSLRKDPQALETAKLGFIEYNSDAKVVAPLTDLPQVQEPTFSAGGGTSLGAGLDLLKEEIKKHVVLGDPKKETKGDYKPLVFHLTDGYPNDKWESKLSNFDRRQVNFIVSCGVPGADRSVLEKVSNGPEYVLELDSASEDELSRFFEFVSSSISYASKSLPVSDDETITAGSLPVFEEASEEML